MDRGGKHIDPRRSAGRGILRRRGVDAAARVQVAFATFQAADVAMGQNSLTSFNSADPAPVGT
jgi:hypothetical protein